MTLGAGVPELTLGPVMLPVLDSSDEIFPSLRRLRQSHPGVVIAYADYYAAMADAVRGRGPVPVDPRDSLKTVRIVELAHRRTAGDED